MEGFLFAVKFICLFSFCLTQDVTQFKIDQIGEVLNIVRRLDTKIQDFEGRLTAMDNKISALDEKLTTLDSKRALDQGQTKESQCTPNLDLLYHTFAEILEGERELMRNISSETCSKSQLNSLKELLATDECEEGSAVNNCSSKAQCTDALVGYKCTCLPGYEGNGFTCEDVDECALDLHHCSVKGQCLNEVGSYSCICQQGFTGDGINCEDVDECITDSHTCSIHATCNNRIGDYTCTCLSGYTGDGFTCADIDECSADVSPCHQNADCINNVGSFECKCKSGYVGDGISSCNDGVLGTCVSPFKEMGDVRCVYPIKDKKRSWEEARQYCKASGAQLLEGIATQKHLDLLKQYFGHLYDGNYAWVGIKDFKWVESGGTALSRSSPLWWSGEPNGTNGYCVGMCVSCSRPAFGDITCNNKRYTLCQKE